MWQHFAVFNAILAFCTASAVLDMTDICTDKRTGDVVPHPYDCTAYFICGVVPSIRYCDHGLHFDVLRKVCNWPEYAHCELLSTAVDNNQNEPNSKPNPKPDTDDNASSTIRLHPLFVAIDIESGKPVNPMEKYDSKNIQCRHFGAYFLPHPGSCRRYYICAYGHLHRHKCGRGTAWNYKTQECELNNEAECYSRIIAGMDIDAERDDIEFDNNNTDDNDDYNHFSTTPYPATTGASTVCFVIDTTFVTGTTLDPTGTTFHPTGTYHTATATDSTWKPTATTPRADSGASPATGGLKCPASGEAYLPNVFDCSKYFICIAGIPVATTCPKGLYWDQNAEFCDLAKNVQCYKN